MKLITHIIYNNNPAPARWCVGAGDALMMVWCADVGKSLKDVGQMGFQLHINNYCQSNIMMLHIVSPI